MTLAGGTRLDLYPFKEKIFTCNYPFHYKQGENETQILMEGRWIRVPNNPGRYIRATAGTYLKHVTWTLGMSIFSVLINFYLVVVTNENLREETS